VVGTRIVLEDGTYHDVDSSDMAFKLTARECFREYFGRMKPVLLEPLMLMEIECPEEFQGSVVGQIATKRGMVVSTNTENGVTTIIAHVPLAETFGYSTDLRSNTQGQGSFSMELHKYAPVPSNIQEDIITERRKEKELVGAK
jgi:elongation factor G